ncbi:hypothetical protein EPN52_00670 [bacterium]|nr:MAG: hypothetical protein EPN52_00670 [bacterium]
MFAARRYATVLPLLSIGAFAALTACGGGGGGGGPTLPPGTAPGVTPSAAPSSSPSSAPSSAPATPVPSGEKLVIAGKSANLSTGQMVGQLTVFPVGAAQPQATYPPAGQKNAAFAPVAVAVDTNGNAFALDTQSDAALEFAPPYTGVPLVVAGSGSTTPVSLAISSQNVLFVSIQALFASSGVSQAVRMYASPYMTEVDLPIPSGTHFAPTCLALDGQGDLFATNAEQFSGDPGTLEYTPPYTGTPTAFAFGGAGSVGSFQGANCAVDTASGELFIGYSSTIAAYAPPYTGAATVISEGALNSGMMAVSSVNHDLFVANGATVDVYAPPYTSKVATVSSGVSQPDLVTVDATGNLFVASTYNGTVTEYAPPYTGAPAWTASGFETVGTALTVVP